MTHDSGQQIGRRTVLGHTAAWLGFWAVGCGGDKAGGGSGGPGGDGAWHVHPGESIQAALDAAAITTGRRRVVVHAGTYRPKQPGQALIWMHRLHDGITLEAEGEVVLTYGLPVRKETERSVGVDWVLTWRGDEIIGIFPNSDFYPFFRTGTGH